MTQFSLPFESARSDRLVLRKAIGHDLNGYIELYSDPQVRRYLGGPIPAKRLRTRLEAHGIASITNDPGAFVIADSPTGYMMGMVTLERRAAHRPGHAADAANELELSYLLAAPVVAPGRGIPGDSLTAADGIGSLAGSTGNSSHPGGK